MSAKNADDLVAKADKKLASFGLFGNKYEDAAELLEKAAVQYKLAKACEFCVERRRRERGDRWVSGARGGQHTACPILLLLSLRTALTSPGLLRGRPGCVRAQTLREERMEGAGMRARAGDRKANRPTRHPCPCAPPSLSDLPPLIIHHHAHSTHTGKEAGGAYEKLAEVQTKLDAKHEAASACVEAAKCYQKTDRAGTGEEEEEGAERGASLSPGGSVNRHPTAPSLSFSLSPISLSLFLSL
jgi:hypothetical protein